MAYFKTLISPLKLPLLGRTLIRLENVNEITIIKNHKYIQISLIVKLCVDSRHVNRC